MSYSASAPKIGTSAPKCPTCGKSVYFNEQVLALEKAWHKRCLKCAQCSKVLDAGMLNDREGAPRRPPDVSLSRGLCSLPRLPGPGPPCPPRPLSIIFRLILSNFSLPKAWLAQSFPVPTQPPPSFLLPCFLSFPSSEIFLPIFAKSNFHYFFRPLQVSRRPQLQAPRSSHSPPGKIYCNPCYSAVSGIKGFGRGGAESHVSGGAAGTSAGAEVLQGTSPLLLLSGHSFFSQPSLSHPTLTRLHRRCCRYPRRHWRPWWCPRPRCRCCPCCSLLRFLRCRPPLRRCSLLPRLRLSVLDGMSNNIFVSKPCQGQLRWHRWASTPCAPGERSSWGQGWGSRGRTSCDPKCERPRRNTWER